MLAELGTASGEMKSTVAKLQFRNWTLQNLTFQPEFPDGRAWNVGAQLAYEPTK